METTHAGAAEPLGLIGRMLHTFTGPAETFEAVQQHHSRADWLVPVLLAVVVSMAAQYATLPVQQRMQREAAAAMMAERDLTPEQQAQQQEAMQRMAGVSTITTLVGVPIATFAMLFLFAGVLLLVARFVLGGDDVTYGQMLAVQAYAGLITIPQNIVLTPIRQARETLMVTLGPGLLLGDDLAATFVGRLIGAIDIFVLWQVVVVAIGLSVLSRAAFGKSLGVMLGLWVVVLALSAGVAGFVPGM